MGRKKSHVERENITKEILLGVLKTGVVLAVAVTAPGLLQVLDSITKKHDEWKKYYPSSLNKQVRKLWRRGHVEVTETSDGYTVRITDKGRMELLKFDIEHLSIPNQKQWDGKWRMVFFDIPAGEGSARTVFQRKLRSLGFFQMQRSVYVYPYTCRKEIAYLREVYGIPHDVKLATVEHLENDEDIRKVFHLS
jgi:DNA-binding transcriptional regulator PaaX